MAGMSTRFPLGMLAEVGESRPDVKKALVTVPPDGPYVYLLFE